MVPLLQQWPIGLLRNFLFVGPVQDSAKSVRELIIGVLMFLETPLLPPMTGQTMDQLGLEPRHLIRGPEVTSTLFKTILRLPPISILITLNH